MSIPHQPHQCSNEHLPVLSALIPAYRDHGNQLGHPREPLDSFSVGSEKAAEAGFIEKLGDAKNVDVFRQTLQPTPS